MKKYKLLNERFVRLLDDKSKIDIPFDMDNTDYQAYLKWLEDGNTPEPVDPIVEPTPPTPAEKLAAAGLTVDELKQLLGL